MRLRILLALAVVSCTGSLPQDLDVLGTCLPEGDARADTASTWSVVTPGSCGADLACDVQTDATKVTLHVTSQLRPGMENIACDMIGAAPVNCAIPPLASGTRTVVVNGTEVATVTFSPAGSMACVTRLDPRKNPPSDKCVPDAAPSNTAVVAHTRFARNALFGLTCLDEVRCEVVVGDRTLDFRHTLRTTGSECRDSNPFVDATCTIPALTDGVWDISIDGKPTELYVIPGAGDETDCALP